MTGFSCGAGRAVTLRAVTAESGCDDYFHDDDGSVCHHIKAPAPVEEPPAGTPEAELRRVMLTLCKLCLAGAGGKCHIPGCALYLNRAPDIALAAAHSELMGPASAEQLEQERNEARAERDEALAYLEQSRVYWTNRLRDYATTLDEARAEIKSLKEKDPSAEQVKAWREQYARMDDGR